MKKVRDDEIIWMLRREEEEEIFILGPLAFFSFLVMQSVWIEERERT